MELNFLGKLLIIAGVSLIILGVIFLLAKNIPYFGHLPGDILIRRKNFSFYFPLTTCILLSILASFIFWLFKTKGR